MAGGASYQRYPQKPAPSSEAIGAALMQQGQGGMGPGPMGGGPGSMAPASLGGMAPPGMAMGGAESMGGEGQEEMMAASGYGDPGPMALRIEGSDRMGPEEQHNAAQLDEPGAHSHNAVSIAVGEALTRMGGGHSVSQNPYKPRASNRRMLQHLGLSDVEARLLEQTGGI